MPYRWVHRLDGGYSSINSPSSQVTLDGIELTAEANYDNFILAFLPTQDPSVHHLTQYDFINFSPYSRKFLSLLNVSHLESFFSEMSHWFTLS